MEIQGKIIDILPLQSGVSKSGKQWQKQEFVIQTSGQHQKEVAFNTFNPGLITLLSNTPIGVDATVHFEPESREYNGKWYTQLSAWKMDSDVTRAYAKAEHHEAKQQVAAAAMPGNSLQTSGGDDLPF